MLNVGNTHRVMLSVSGPQVRTSEPRRMSSRGGVVVPLDHGCIIIRTAKYGGAVILLEVVQLKIPCCPKSFFFFFFIKEV